MVDSNFTTDPRPPSRRELSAVFKDQRTLRAFEKLFDLLPGDLIAIIEAIESVGLIAEIASSRSLSVEATIIKAKEEIEKILSAPTQTNDNFLLGDYIDLNSNGHNSRERRMQWNEDEGTVDIGLLNDVVLQVGQEIHYYAKNTSGGNIDNGTPVMFNGLVGSSPKFTFEEAVSDGTYPPGYMMGVTTQDFADNDLGYVTQYGVVRGLRTDGVPYGESWSQGDALYIDPTTPGGWTNILPTAPSLKTPFAVVMNVSSGNAGSIFVKFDTIPKVSELQDVEISSVADGDLLQYSSANSRWENVSGATGSFTTLDGKTVTVTNGIVTNIV